MTSFNLMRIGPLLETTAMALDMAVAGFVFLSPPLLAPLLPYGLTAEDINFYQLVSYAAGTFALGYLSDRLGRKTILLLTKAMLLMGVAFALLLPVRWAFQVYCWMMGLSLGPSNTLVLVVATEVDQSVSKVRIQILLGCFALAEILLGYLVLWLGSGLTYIGACVLLPTLVQTLLIVTCLEETYPEPS
jgi:MFS family permease